VRRLISVDGTGYEPAAEAVERKGLSLDNRIGRKESRLGQRRNERICKWE
jgi:hypothetical protein